MWLCIDRRVHKEAKTLTFFPICLIRRPSSCLFAVTLGCPSCLINLLALICDYISIPLPPPVHGISAHDLHDASISEAIRRRRLRAHPPICAEGQAKVFASPPLTSPRWQNKLKSTARRQKNPWDFTLYLLLACQSPPPSKLPCLVLSGRTFPRSCILFYHSPSPHSFLLLPSSHSLCP